MALTEEEIQEVLKHKDMTEIVEEAETAREYRNILESVAVMRSYQKAYFKDRKKEDLIESKRLEASVDMRLAEAGIRK